LSLTRLQIPVSFSFSFPFISGVASRLSWSEYRGTSIKEATTRREAYWRSPTRDEQDGDHARGNKKKQKRDRGGRPSTRLWSTSGLNSIKSSLVSMVFCCQRACPVVGFRLNIFLLASRLACGRD
jgi:hypothetical protein